MHLFSRSLYFMLQQHNGAIHAITIIEKCSKTRRLQLAPAEPCAAAKLRCAGARVV